MNIGIRRLADLVKQYGSPAYVYDLGRVTAAWKALCDALPAGATRFYSLKANPHPAVAAHLHGLGARAEVSSIGELQASVEAGFPVSETLMTGPAKSAAVLKGALALGCRHFSVESGAELARLTTLAEAVGAEVTALLRVNVDDGARPRACPSVAFRRSSAPTCRCYSRRSTPAGCRQPDPYAWWARTSSWPPTSSTRPRWWPTSTWRSAPPAGWNAPAYRCRCSTWAVASARRTEGPARCPRMTGCRIS